MVGTSAVHYDDGIETDSLKYQLGTTRDHTAFEGELVGIILGTHLATKHPTIWTSINHSIDNQATMGAMQNNSRQPAQYLIDEIHRSTEELRPFLDDERRQDPVHRPRNDTDATHNTSLSFTWVAGHMDLTSNERADALTKEAAEYGSSPENSLPIFLRRQLPISISVIKQSISTNIKQLTRKWWQKSPRFKKNEAYRPLTSIEPIPKNNELTQS